MSRQIGRKTGMSPQLIEAAYRAACNAELDALKPGNVHRFAGGHGMDAAVFERSAEASAPEIAAAGRPVGRRVLGAMRATWAVAGMNTNLGILLLCAPLAAAAERAVPPAAASGGCAALRHALAETLSDLSTEDAADVFAAIALASPGGLGERPDHDVRRPPTIALLEAMRIASPEDRVAAEYVDRFAGVFEVGIPEIRRSRAAGRQGMWPAIDGFLAFATSYPDSHVARKYGAAAAEGLRLRMLDARNRLNRLDNAGARQETLLMLDAELKAEGINPGTSADLTVASIFADELATALEE